MCAILVLYREIKGEVELSQIKKTHMYTHTLKHTHTASAEPLPDYSEDAEITLPQDQVQFGFESQLTFTPEVLNCCTLYNHCDYYLTLLIFYEHLNILKNDLALNGHVVL